MFLSETLPASHNLLFRVSHPRRKNSCVGPYYEGRTREGSNPVLGPANGAPFITMLSDFFPPFHHLSSFVYFQDRVLNYVEKRRPRFFSSVPPLPPARKIQSLLSSCTLSSCAFIRAMPSMAGKVR
jgi:hypothetical protein